MVKRSVSGQCTLANGRQTTNLRLFHQGTAGLPGSRGETGTHGAKVRPSQNQHMSS